MNNQNNENGSITFKIGYMLGWLLLSFLRILYNGLVKASKKYPVLLVSFFGLFCITLIAIFQNAKYSIPLSVIMFLAFCFGILITIQEYPERKKVKQFNAIFEEIKLKALDDSVPEYIKTENAEYAFIYCFYSLIPFTEWKKKQETLEMYLNEKIIDIIQDENNNRIIHLVVQKSPLPTMVEWDDDLYLDRTDRPYFALGIGYYDLALLGVCK